MIITSSDNDKIKALKKLNTRKYRDEEGLFLVEGEHLVEEAYKSNLLLEIILLENDDYPLDIKKTNVSENIMKELSSLTTPPTIIGVCKKKKSDMMLGNHLLLLDSIQDPGNLGTIIRSALAFDIDSIVVGNGTVDIYNPKVLRATQGLLFHINIVNEEMLNIIPQLKKDNYTIIGTSLINGIELNDYLTPSKYALIMGNEGHGLDEKVNHLCDEFVYIKMNNACESLNVGVACSIILYHLNVR